MIILGIGAMKSEQIGPCMLITTWRVSTSHSSTMTSIGLWTTTIIELRFSMVECCRLVSLEMGSLASRSLMNHPTSG